MNKLGIHSFIWTAVATNADAERAISLTAKAGFDLIEIAAMDLAAIDVTFTRRTLEIHKIGATMSFGLDADHDVSSNDQARVNAGRERLLKEITVARDVGATHVCGILYGAFQKYDRPPTAEGIARSVAVVRHVGEVAAESGITLGLEVVNRYESNVLNTAAQAVEFVKRVGLPNVLVHLDCYHMNIEESDVAGAIQATGKHLGYFHTGDSHRGYLGSGSIDSSRIFRALVAINYEGPITFESFSSRVVGQPLEGILGIWRNLWEYGWDLAVHARAYTLAHLKAAQEAAANVSRSQLP